MINITEMLILLLVCINIGVFVLTRKRPHNPCKKDKNKECPHEVSVTINGTLRSKNLHQCCGYIDQMNAMKTMLDNMKPDVDYNGMYITKELKNRLDKSK